ncbi:hypothetical protein MNBD_GAMMA12-3519 [hydrothermal vent metagenome]|uniref:DUF3301 domain-containing protein n=1 Tax=hydrothermal vent metagenome TaxID=652676 RepID=A0A3B0YEP4_9ZZZZ
MTITELILILGVAVLIWFWLESMKISESARAIGAENCRKNSVQFLDDTVHLVAIKFGRNNHGRVVLFRKYKYEFTNSEIHRYNGEIIMSGREHYHSYMDVYRIEENDSDVSSE